jgi:hypothetical protein
MQLEMAPRAGGDYARFALPQTEIGLGGARGVSLPALGTTRIKPTSPTCDIFTSESLSFDRNGR